MAELIGIHPNSLARMERDEIGMKSTTEKLIRLILKTSTPINRRETDAKKNK